MQIVDADGRTLNVVYLALTETEAMDLIGQLGSLIESDDPTDHRHVSSADYQTEIAVALQTADDESPWGAGRQGV